MPAPSSVSARSAAGAEPAASATTSSATTRLSHRTRIIRSQQTFVIMRKASENLQMQIINHCGRFRQMLLQKFIARAIDILTKSRINIPRKYRLLQTAWTIKPHFSDPQSSDPLRLPVLRLVIGGEVFPCLRLSNHRDRRNP